MFLALLTLLLIALFLQGTVTTVPLALVVLLISGIHVKQKAFILAFFAGLLLDILLIRNLGITSLFFLIFSALFMLYQRKYEINSYPFVLVSSFAGSYLYLLLFERASILQAGISCIIAVVLFAIIKITKFSI